MANIVKQDNRLMISGDLNFSTVTPVLWKQCLLLFSNCPELNFDLSQVQSVNSAGLALLIECVKYAQQTNKVIQFTNIPQQLMTMAQAAGVGGLFK